MFRALFAVIIIALFPLIALAEEQTNERGVEVKAEKDGQVVAVSVNMKSGEVKISISNAEKKDEEKKQKNEIILPGSNEPAPSKKHSRRRGK